MLVERIGTDVASLGPDAAVGAGLVAELEAEQEAARRVVVEALSSARYVALLDRLDEVADPPLSGSETTLTEVWARQWKRTRGAVSALPPVPADDELHAVRIAIKRARYAAELAGHELGKKGAVFVDAAKDAQDVLGEHQDAHVAEERIVRWADATPEAAVAAGRLVQLERERRVAMRAAWPGSWRRLDSGRRGSPLSDVIRAAGGVPVRVVDGAIEVLLVHRPPYGDWTFPKGKCEAGESDEELRHPRGRGGDGPAAASLEEELPSTEYLDDKGPSEARALLADAGRRR